MNNLKIVSLVLKNHANIIRTAIKSANRRKKKTGLTKAQARKTHPLGRPSMLKDYIMDQAERLASIGATQKQIAEVWGICDETLSRWKRKNPELKQRLKKGRAKANLSVQQRLFKKASEEGNVVAMIFWLTNMAPEEWKDRRALVNNKISQAVINGNGGREAALNGFDAGEVDAQFESLLRRR